tara:strand:- start:2952 stop:4355 length:1404 start_codon:yes stop_codon:yes gene_type:complete
MADTNNNITIDISGNTASMATDYGHGGPGGFTASHVPVSKLVWGDKDSSKRVTLTDPFPIQLAGQTGPLEFTGKISGQTNANIAITNYIGKVPGGTTYGQTHFIAVAGSTNGQSLIGVTGTIQGMVNGTPVEVTGSVRIQGAMADDSYGGDGTVRGILIQGTSAGNTASVAGESFPGYGFGVPIAITGGRRLSSGTDSVTVVGTINSTGGRQLAPLTDSVSVYGSDGGQYVKTNLYNTNGATAGFSGDALKVAIVNAAEGITFSVAVSTVTGVTNASEPPLRVQGYAGSAGDPLTVKGQNDGALEIVSTAGLSTTVSNTVSINDTDIINSLESTSKPLISNLASMKANTSPISAIKTAIEGGKLRAQITGINRPTDLRSGSKTVTSNAQPLNNNLELRVGVTVKASPENSNNVLVGNRGLASNTDQGYILEPGESIFLEINNINKIYVRTSPGDLSGETHTVNYIGS